jgi:hypothetical protein
MATKKAWVLTPQKKAITEADKTQLTNLFEPLINDYKKKFIEAKPNKKENYVVNFYCKFYRGFFYLCAEYRAEYENRTLDGFEEKFARLEFVDSNTYNLAYYRHTGQWWTVKSNVTPEFCFETIKNNPLFFS